MKQGEMIEGTLAKIDGEEWLWEEARIYKSEMRIQRESRVEEANEVQGAFFV